MSIAIKSLKSGLVHNLLFPNEEIVIYLIDWETLSYTPCVGGESKAVGTSSITTINYRLITIESQPKKVVVVCVIDFVFVVVIIVGQKNITLEFGQKRVNNS